MKKNVTKSVNFTNDVKVAKVEVKKACKDIFFLRAQLRTLARKNEYCEGKDVAKVAKAVRNYTNGGCLFDLNAFMVDAFGNYCYKITRTTVNAFGKKEKYVTTRNITLSVTGLFNAFCAVAKAEIKAIEEAEYNAKCAEEKAQKAHIRNVNMKLKELAKALDKGILSKAEYNAKVAAL